MKKAHSKGTLLLFAIGVSLWGFSVFAQQKLEAIGPGKMNVAVLNLKSSSGVTSGECELISDRLRGDLFNTGKVNVMERDQMQEVLKEQGFQSSGACTDEACLVQMGQLLGVQALVTGSLGKVGSMFLVNIRMIDVKTAKIVKVVSVDVKGDIEDVVGKLKDIAEQLVGAASEAKKELEVTTTSGSPQQQVPVQQQQTSPLTPQTVPQLLSNFHHHKGFYLSMALGLGFGDIDLDAQNATYSNMTLSGGGMEYDFKIGYALVENFILSFDVIGRDMFSPDMSIDGTDVTSVVSDLTGSDNAYGIGLTYYFMPANVFISGSIDLVTLSITGNVSGNSFNSSSQTGFALHLKIGKEWWVSKRWGLGASAGYGYVSANDKSDPSNPAYSGTLSTNKFFVMFNTTYN